MNSRVLVVDDEPDIRELLEITLGRMSLETVSADSIHSAVTCLAGEKFSLCLTDMKLPDGDGLDLVEHIQQKYPDCPVAVITAHGSTETAIKTLKGGAFDFVSKPIDLQKLRDLVQAALTLTPREQSSLPYPSGETPPGDIQIIGTSAPILQLKKLINRFARSQAPIYISGPSGSGKELAARAIHAQSGRAAGPFIAVNCGAIPADLVESELFGHLKGSFTGASTNKPGRFQLASGGTLLLDEVAELPLQAQVKLLRVIQEKAVWPIGSNKEIPVNVRILSATHKDLALEVEKGRFRHDLFYRINVIELAVPSLQSRVEDIEQLAEFILANVSKENGLPPYQLSPAALTKLKAYSFPGNIRELENILQRAATLAETQTIHPEQLDLNRFATTAPQPPAEVTTESVLPATAETGFSLEQHLKAIEIKAIEKALQESKWNKTLAAKRLGMSFRALRYRLKKLGLD